MRRVHSAPHPPERPIVALRHELIGLRATIALIVGAFVATVFIFAVPPTPFDALDYRSILLPYLTYYRASLGGGEFPFWNPLASLGRPFAADPQALVFWPGTIAYLLFGSFWGMILLAWLHASAAAWSTAKLCLRLGAARAPALCAGLVFVLSGKITGHYQAGHVQFVFSYLLLPMLLEAGLQVQDIGDRRAVAWLAAVSAWQLLAGAPQVYWNCAIAVALLLAGRRLTWNGRALLRGWFQDGWRVAAAYALGFATTGVAMVPLAELVQQSNRGTARADFTAVGSMAWPHWLSALTPSVAKGYTVDWELLLYPGAAVTLLGVSGLMRVRDRSVRALWLVVLGLGLIAAGEHTPLFPVLVKMLPGYASFRVHGRSGAVLILALIISATLLVSSRETPRRQLARLGGTALGLFLLLGFLSVHSQADIGRPVLYFSAATMAAVLWLAARSQRLRTLGGLALAVGLMVDLLMTDVGLKRIFVTSQNYALEAPLVAALHESGQLVLHAPPPRIFAPPKAVRANAGMIYGFGTFAGSEALALERVWNYVHWAVGFEPPAMSDIYAFEIFAAKGPFPVPWVAQSASLDLRSSQIEIRPAPPRAWLVHHTRQVADWREAAGRLAAGHDASQSALLESPWSADFAADKNSATIPATIDAVQWKDFSRNHLRLRVSTGTPALLTLAEAWYPGWRATVNGSAVPVMPVNGWMRGVALPAGVSHVELGYRPTHFVFGAALSLLSLSLLAWLARPFKAQTI